ncbi:hypothetical protein AVEN_217776-1 [Araneus ventricosus]|uniref:Mos1 transposase HTH domain-containing protein n=1 Tax=Araneus ventricosus TaxID=182803 RepID=A0A4Y2TTD9_ARAVE|nr:hypothetical protein AVEN_217776-1 [Araneus ventricosus]
MAEIAVELPIRKGTVHHIIHKKLGYGKVCAQWVSKHLVHLCQGITGHRGKLDPSPVAETTTLSTYPDNLHQAQSSHRRKLACCPTSTSKTPTPDMPVAVVMETGYSTAFWG